MTRRTPITPAENFRQRARPLWTPEDDRFLKSYALEWTLGRLAAHLGRSERAVQIRAWRLGLSSADWRFELTAVQAAEMVCVCERSVRNWIASGKLRAWRRPKNAPHRIPPRSLRSFLLRERKGVLAGAPAALLDLIATPPSEVPPTLELSLVDCQALTLARAHEIERLIARKVLPMLGVVHPVRTKDLRELAINQPEVIPALRRVPVETVQLLADLWG